MIRGIGRLLHGYYLAVLSVIILGTAGVFYYFWYSGPSNSQHVAVVYETSFWLEELQKNNYPDQIKFQVNAENVMKARKYIEFFERRVRSINQVKSADEFYPLLQSDIAVTKELMSGLASLPKPLKILQVLTKKVTRFNQFAANNKWRTLERSSRRILAKIDNSSGHTFAKIIVLNKVVLQDFSMMKNITNASVLSRSDKRIINSRLNLLRTEMMMLEKYIANVRSFLTSLKKLKKSYLNWLKHIAPAISLEKIMLHRKSKQLTLLFVGTFFIMIGFLWGGILVYGKHKKQTQKSVERYALSLIKDSLLPAKLDFREGTAEFQREFAQNHHYIHKRMSFGTIFRDTFPFAAVLLDEELKIIWSNQKFHDSWQITKTQVEQGEVSWESIYQLTNLSEVDPIVDAMHSSMAGIYQIRLRSGTRQPTPFEMYVNPVEYSGQKRVMVFFYPLSSLEQTIADQAKSIMAPIDRSLEALIDRGFSGAKMELARDEFFAAGVDSLFDRFQALSESLGAERQAYAREVAQRRDEAKRCRELLSQVMDSGARMREVQEFYCCHLVNLKSDIIDFCEHTKTQHLNEESIIFNVREMVKNYQHIFEISHRLDEKINRGQKAMEGMERLRGLFAKVAEAIETSRYQLGQAVDQFAVHCRMANLQDEKLLTGISGVKTKVKAFDVVFGQLLKSIQTLDLVLSKMHLIMEQGRSESDRGQLRQGGESFKHGEKEFSALVANSKNILHGMERREEKIINDLRKIYGTTLEMGEVCRTLSATLLAESGCLGGIEARESGEDSQGVGSPAGRSLDAQG